MLDVNALVAESAEGIDISGRTGTGTEPPVKKEPMAKKRYTKIATMRMPGANVVRDRCHVLCWYSFQNMEK
jgi:hypothetical protein